MDFTLSQLSSQSSRTLFLSTSYNEHSNDTDRERRSCPATLFPFQPQATPPMEKLVPTEEPQFFRSGSSKISAEAPLHQTSLMARVSLGPSVAPCLVEPSTVHDAALIWVENFSLTKSEILVLFISVLKLERNLATKMASLPVTTSSTPICDMSPYSRQTRNDNCSNKRKLGFPLMGLFHKLGPTLKSWPRYTILIMLSSPHLLTLLYFASMTRRHLPCLVLTSKPRSCDYQSLILLISAYWPQPFEHVFLRILDLLHPRTPRRHGCDSKLFQEEFSHWISLTAGDTPGPSLASCPVRVSRTHGNSLLWMDTFIPEIFSRFGSSKSPPSFSLMFCLHGLIGRRRLSYLEMTYLNWLCENLTQNLVLVSSIAIIDENLMFLISCLVPVRLEPTEHFSTSQCLMIRTIHHFPERIANVASTYLSLACDLVLLCSCLRVLLDLMSNYLSCLLHFHYAICLVVSSFILGETLNFVIFPFA